MTVDFGFIGSLRLGLTGLASGQTTPIRPGEDVTFTFTVTNQGTNI